MADPAQLLRAARRRLLSRRIPHTLVSWRFLLPCHGPIALHRRVFLRGWQELPRGLYALASIYSLLLWYGFFAWRALARAYRENAGRVAEQGTGHLKQLGQLLVAVGRGLLPSLYYRLELYRVRPEGWWEFVPDTQLPHWHQVMQGARPSSLSVRLMTDKGYFADQLASAGLPAVPTLLDLPAGSVLDLADPLFTQTLFFKPRSAARAEGCFLLRPRTGNLGLEVVVDGAVVAAGDAVAPWLNSVLAQRHYLVQPLLRNRQDLHALVAGAVGCVNERIVTLRLITCSIDGKVALMIGNLEVSGEDHQRLHMFPIDVRAGIAAVGVQQLKLPDWPAVVEAVCGAHRFCSDLLTVGWDLVISDRGVRLLEGNLNWGVQAHQVPPRQPLLAGPLYSIYCEGRVE